MTRKVVMVSLPEKLYEELMRFVEETGVSKNAVIKTALAKFLRCR